MDVPLLRPSGDRSSVRQMSYEDEAEIIISAAKGNRLAMRTLVDQNKYAVYGLAYHMLGRTEDAEDVTQEVFLRAWKALPNWRPEAKLSTWLHRVTVNLCYDQLRKKKPTLFAEPPDIADTALSQGANMALAQRQAAVRAAIAQLPERQRAALTLTSLQGHSNISAAEILEIKLPALESLLARARRNLKTFLTPLKESL